MTRRHRELPGGAVVVIGASSGIGRATAHALAAQGRPLVLASRSLETLEAVAVECRAVATSAGVGRPIVSVARVDVTDRDAVDALMTLARSRHPRVDAVVSTVAVVAYGRFDVVPAEAFDQVMNVNLLGAANVARSALRLFADQGGGRLVVVGSLLGRIATPWMSTYVTSKWAVHGLARTLQIEARRMPGVDVSLISPGGVDTPIYSQAASYGGRNGRPPPPVSRPEAVARAVVRAVDRPRRFTSVGPTNPLTEAGFRYLPGVYDRLVTPLMSVAGLSPRHVEPHPGNLWEPTPAGEAMHGRWGRHWLRGVGAAAVLGGAVVVRGLVAQRRDPRS
ncbi:SDR family NAD(P)-dependent oxidoreductase [Cellulomonas xylanilytica]|uniref:Short-chain dehydrogenase n=1 Tax=Cellulomonas xylanilytica TaxID=233583 RepID=A0A510VE02_9CELL|nr:SDR family NAD(P)-dependent oxidoreductase [Cellulomonas xylanilytica]GEK23430.1 short-chain dehydrogenase [Cellulomonas xylanilytica]